MRKLFTTFGLLLTIVLLTSSISVYAQKTIVYVVRHAEKDLSDPANRDPHLNGDGKKRAQELDKVLKSEKVAAIFSTPYKRTQETVAPLAERLNLTPITYNATDFKSLTEKIKTGYSGKSVVVTGHSNTVLEIVEALGGERPVSALTEDDYDYLFKVMIGTDGKVETRTLNYGKSTKKG